MIPNVEAWVAGIVLVGSVFIAVKCANDDERDRRAKEREEKEKEAERVRLAELARDNEVRVATLRRLELDVVRSNFDGLADWVRGAMVSDVVKCLRKFDDDFVEGRRAFRDVLFVEFKVELIRVWRFDRRYVDFVLRSLYSDKFLVSCDHPVDFERVLGLVDSCCDVGVLGEFGRVREFHVRGLNLPGVDVCSRCLVFGVYE